MNKNTILAVILSILIITGGMFVQSYFFPPEYVEKPVEVGSVEKVSTEETEQLNQTLSLLNKGKMSIKGIGDQKREIFNYNTDDFIIKFDTKGATISSLKLKNHLDNGKPVELIYRKDNMVSPFTMYVGDNLDKPLDDNFSYILDGNKIIFSKTYASILEDGSLSKETFKLIKTYKFAKKGYLFEININLVNSENKVIPLRDLNYSYTLAFEPQIGPAFNTEPDGKYVYRTMYIKPDNASKKQSVSIKNNEYKTSEMLTWGAITGKYFSCIAIPDATKYSWTFTEYKEDDNNKLEIPQTNSIYLTRPIIKTSNISDTYRFYIGPNLSQDMSIYDSASENEFGLSDLDLEKSLDSSFWLGWLENILKFFLQLFYKIIPNYGVAIILLTIMIKILLYPLAKKSTRSQAKMKELQPEQEEIKAKYKDNPTKMNQEMSALYKKHNVNPASGCLPLLIQFPIFIALYGLLNKHFELRGAMFIPGWITDLSLPDTVYVFSFNIPFLGNALHILPIIYTASMILSSKIASGGNSMGNMGKFMTIGMPLIFFFILYNAPSGLILYWTVMNIITVLQQVYVTKKLERHPELADEPSLFAKARKKAMKKGK